MPATWIPAEPETADAPRGSGRISLRYEDVAQDGRAALVALPQALGESVWRAMLRNHPADAVMRAEGILPILSRLVIVGEDGPCSVDRPLEATGTFEPACGLGPDGEVERLYLNMWARVEGPRARTFDPQPERAGERQLVGCVFGEHVFTRPFSPPAARKVTTLTLPGLPARPERVYAARSLAALLDAPADATPLDAASDTDELAITFSLSHTDSNQHVNSLVYPRLFEDAATRRLAQRGVARPVLARAVELLYRKPFFAGERARIVLRVFRGEGHFHAIGAFYADDALRDGRPAANARPHCVVRMLLR
jgi:hypothetical protein